MARDLDRRYARDPDFIARRVVDEVILVPIRKSLGDLESIFTLNEVAARIWELLDGTRRLADVHDVLTREFDGDAQAMADDLDEFVGQLESIGAVRAA
jgi:hypothetical protein